MADVQLIRGRMTAAEKNEIDRLAAALRKPTPSAIARRLNRHPATVAWYMIRNGLIERTIRYRGGSYRRATGLVHHWTQPMDRRLLELRRAGCVYREIAEILTREFFPRNGHQCNVRAVMLAAYDGGEDNPANWPVFFS